MPQSPLARAVLSAVDGGQSRSSVQGAAVLTGCSGAAAGSRQPSQTSSSSALAWPVAAVRVKTLEHSLPESVPCCHQKQQQTEWCAEGNQAAQRRRCRRTDRQQRLDLSYPEQVHNPGSAGHHHHICRRQQPRQPPQRRRDDPPPPELRGCLDSVIYFTLLQFWQVTDCVSMSHLRLAGRVGASGGGVVAEPQVGGAGRHEDSVGLKETPSDTHEPAGNRDIPRLNRVTHRKS